MRYQQGCDAASAPYHNSAKALHRLLRDCGLNQAELARRVDVHPNTVTAWSKGKSPIPGAVQAYLELLAKVKALT